MRQIVDPRLLGLLLVLPSNLRIGRNAKRIIMQDTAARRRGVLIVVKVGSNNAAQEFQDAHQHMTGMFEGVKGVVSVHA